MSIGILGNKIGMTQIFDEEGNAVPITIIKFEEGFITDIKTEEKHGYNAIQVGYSEISPSNLKKPELGVFNKKNLPSLKYLKEFKTLEPESFVIGQPINFNHNLFNEYVDITGYSIGKGFAGNQKRNNFSRGPMTHGSKNHRAPGSIGACATPARVFPGKKMAGQLGNSKVTISNLKIINLNLEENLILIKGSIPGKPGNLILIKPAKKIKK